MEFDGECERVECLSVICGDCIRLLWLLLMRLFNDESVGEWDIGETHDSDDSDAGRSGDRLDGVDVAPFVLLLLLVKRLFSITPMLVSKSVAPSG